MRNFIVELPQRGGQTRRADTLVIVAGDNVTEDEIKSLAKARFGSSGGSDAAWQEATVTEVMNALDCLGITFNVTLTDNNDPDSVISVTYTGVEGDDSDIVGDELATMLNATAISNASYVDNVLTIVDAADNMGDWVITATAVSNSESIYFEDAGTTMPVMMFGLTDAGAEDDARTVNIGYPPAIVVTANKVW
jgi:hypothetical protein